MATKHDDPCRDNAADDEPLFTLRAQDALAPQLVIRWADLAAEAGAPPEKIAEARTCAARMIEWQNNNHKKMPD